MSAAGTSPERDPAARDGSSWAAIRAVLAGRGRGFSALAVVSLASGVVEAVLLVLVTKLALDIADGSDVVELRGYELPMSAALGAAVAIVVVRIGLGLFSNWQGSRLTADVVAQYRRQLASAYLRAEWTAQQARHSGQLQELLTTFIGNGATLISNVVLALRSGLSLLALLVVAFVVDPRASVLVIVSVSVFAAILRPLRRAVKRSARANASAGLRFSTRLNELSHVTMDVHVFGVHDAIEWRVRQLVDENARASRKLMTLRGSVPVVYAGLGYVAIVIALVALRVGDVTSVASVGASMVVMLRSLTYGQSVQTATASIASSAPFVEMLDDEMARLRESARPDGIHPAPVVQRIEFRHVEFSYHPDQPVLHDVDFVLGPHEIVGIVGPSGGGKTTMTHLLLGLRSPTSGQVLADGVVQADIARSDWSRRVTYVPQQAHLLSGTVADNIRFGRDGVTDADVVRAATLAHLHDDVMGWADGYDHDVGERGSRLSGGQQQRLSIARALVESPDFFVLDEPTSALDARSEMLIRSTLLELRDQRTIVIVAHRPATLDICDRIMVVDHGRILAFDTRASLERSSEAFKRVVLAAGLS